MRTISFILAFAFILAGPSIAGSSDSGLPGIGTFPYNGSPVTTRRRSRSLSQRTERSEQSQEICR